MAESIIQKIGVVAAVCLPLFNIPLVIKILRRKSSQDLSLTWVVGVWTCIILMAPSGFISSDIVWKVFNIVNVLFFTAVMIVAVKYRNGIKHEQHTQ